MAKSYDPTDLQGQEKVAELSAQLRKNERDDEIDAFKWLMNDARGRKFVWRLLDKAGVYRSSFTGNSETFFREGARNLGLMVIAEIHELCPEAYFLMLKENSNHGTRRTSE
jgi:hypothetical protein